MNNKLNELMAERVMGWHKSGIWWFDKNNKEVYIVGGYATYGDDSQDDWIPTESIAQALRCLCSMRDKYLEQPLLWNICNGDGDSLDVDIMGVYRQVKTLDELPKAICEAISEAIGGEG